MNNWSSKATKGIICLNGHLSVFLLLSMVDGEKDFLSPLSTLNKSPIKRRFADFYCPGGDVSVSILLKLFHFQFSFNCCIFLQEKTRVCQNCIKITRAIGAYEACCTNKRNAFKWCKRIFDFTHPQGWWWNISGRKLWKLIFAFVKKYHNPDTEFEEKE